MAGITRYFWGGEKRAKRRRYWIARETRRSRSKKGSYRKPQIKSKRPTRLEPAAVERCFSRDFVKDFYAALKAGNSLPERK